MQIAVTQQHPRGVTDAPIDRLRAVLARGGEHLGDLLWWTLADATVQRDHLEAVWSGAALPSSLLPERPTPDKALRLAARAAHTGRTGYLVRLGKDDGKDADRELVYAVIRETRLDDGSLEHRQESRVALRGLSTALVCDDPQHPVVQSITEHYLGHLHVHTADDVRRLLVRALREWAAVSLRENGGIYWVPPGFAAPLRRLEAAIAQLGASHAYVVPVHHTPEGAQALGDVARGSIEDELATLRKELEAFATSPPDRTSTLERRLEAFEEVRGRAHLYRDILSVQVQDLDAQLDQMEHRVREMIGGVA